MSGTRLGYRRFMRAYSSKENIMKKRFFVFLAVLGLVVALGTPTASTAAYPDRPITLVLPVSAGGSHDLHARGITSIIADILGQPMVVKLVPGGAGMKGTGFVAKAKADGYTLLFTSNVFDQLVPQTRKVPFDTLRDFKAVAKINHGQPVFFSLANRPWKNHEGIRRLRQEKPRQGQLGPQRRLGRGPRAVHAVRARGGHQGEFHPAQRRRPLSARRPRRTGRRGHRLPDPASPPQEGRKGHRARTHRQCTPLEGQ